MKKKHFEIFVILFAPINKQFSRENGNANFFARGSWMRFDDISLEEKNSLTSQKPCVFASLGMERLNADDILKCSLNNIVEPRSFANIAFSRCCRNLQYFSFYSLLLRILYNYHFLAAMAKCALFFGSDGVLLVKMFKGCYSKPYPS